MKSSLDILFTVLTTYFVTLGLWSLDDYIDKDVDKVMHSTRAIPSGLLQPATVLKVAALSLAISLIIPVIKIFVARDFTLLLMACLFVMLGIIVVNIHRILKTGYLQNLVKMVIVASLIGLVFPTAGGFSEKMIILGTVVGFSNLGCTIILDYMDASGDRLIGYKFLDRLRHVSGILYLLSSLIIWVPYFSSSLHQACFTPLVGLTLCSIALSIICFTGKIDKKVKVFAALGQILMVVILIIEVLTSR